MISQEERIKNQGKIIVYPFMIVATKSNFKTIWDMFIGLFVLYSSFVSPLDIAFDFEPVGQLLYTIGDYITLGLFILDILINLRTSYFTDSNDEIID